MPFLWIFVLSISLGETCSPKTPPAPIQTVPRKLTRKLTTELTRNEPTEFTTELTTRLTMELPMKLATELATRLTMELPMELPTELTTELTTVLKTELSAKLTAELSEGIITSANVTKAEIWNNEKYVTSITFSLEWRSHYENIYSYSIYARVFDSSNGTKGLLKFQSRKIAIYHENGKIDYSTDFNVKYFPSTTYEIRFACCGYNAKADNCVSYCTIHDLCKLQQQKAYYKTSPITPEVQFKNMISCDDTTCEIDVNLKRIQTKNSSLYVFKPKNEGAITLDFVKNIREMNDIYAIEIPWSDPNNVKVMFNKTDVCNFTIYLILVNDYFGLLNYTTIPLPRKPINCTSKKQILLVLDETNGNSTRTILPVTPETNGKSTKQSLQVPHETNGNYYYLLIIPIALIAIAIITFIKRKSLYKFYRKFTTNQPRIEPTSEPLMLQTDFVVKFKNSSLTPEKLKNKLKGDILKVKSDLTNEFVVITTSFDNSYLHCKTVMQKFTGEHRKLALAYKFQKIPEGVSQKTYGELFKDKNRYEHIIPYEESRVVLNLLENKIDSHYINASYIKGYQNDKKYVATQGPTTETLGDFWRMIWQEQTTLIIMLTNLKENGLKKCEKYWPDKGDKLYEDYTVAHQHSQKYVEYTRRDFVLSHKDTKRNVTQLHFTIWPDKGIPETPYCLVKFLKEARKHINMGPIVVHSSAGIGRPGTFILCDYIIDSLTDLGNADFPLALRALRECRKNMVQYLTQYLYSYCVVNEYLNGNLIEISVGEFKENNVSEVNFVETLRNIQNCDYWLNILKPPRICPGYNENKHKHRKDAKPPENFIGFTKLQLYPNSDKESFYVDAVEILNEAGNIISTSQPLPNTLSAFWRLIVEKNISVVLSLQELDVNDEDSIKFWPTKEETLKPVDFIKLTLLDISGDVYDSIYIKLEDLKNKEEKYVYILHFKNWKRNSLPKTNDFLLYFKHFTKHPSKQSILIACYNATDASSVFITFLYLVKKLKPNLTIDVNTAISTLKLYRKNFNLDLEKLRFLYDVMHVYVRDLSQDFYKDTRQINEDNA